jgi:hypothetical protein
MKYVLWSFIAVLISSLSAPAQVRIDEDALGNSLGGWKKRSKQAAEYPLSGATYRTYKPEITPTPDGGIFVSVRIDHLRGWLASDDHAVLEVTVNPEGLISSAQSSIAIQGRSISSDVIRSSGELGKEIVGADRAVQIGTDLLADLSAKLLREKIVEAGRVSFPAVLRHNYNLLFQSIRVEKPAPQQQDAPAPVEEPQPATSTLPVPSPASAPENPADPPPAPEPPSAPPVDVPANSSLEIKPYPALKPTLPVRKQ